MIDKKIVKHLSDISLTLFRKNFFGIYHGSISKKVEHNYFVINTKEAIFDEITESTLCELNMSKKDYSWNFASIEAEVHQSIYTKLHEAKYIACGMPPYTCAYSLVHDEIQFEDYFGKLTYDKIIVHDPGNFNTWYERSSIEVPKLLSLSKNSIVIIKGVGVYVCDRDMNQLIKKVAILENSCRLLTLKSQFNMEQKICLL
ncbi:class II aldolase and adducin N-terminal domain-containing protein [Arcobacteraceae bacterium]|nr:class II aldolase and adducin N-terminal domain-containing protein [Arcobacteraceae bacterium]